MNPEHVFITDWTENIQDTEMILCGRLFVSK